MIKDKSIKAPCPDCGKTNRFTPTDWQRSIKDARVGKTAKLSCVHCYHQPLSTEWHRAYEREQFSLVGIVTPRMLKDQASGATHEIKRG